MAAVSGRIVQTAVSAHQSKNLRLLTSGKICAVKLHRNVPPQGLGFTSTDMLAMQKSTSVETKKLLCNASQSGTAVSSFEKVDFLKLQNGSDIRGVAVDGVEGESVSLTEPVTEAISAAFAGWLSNKKKSEGSKRLRVSIGHDSRISAKNLQDAASRGLVSAGIEVIHYGLASTPAMFNSTLTQDEANHCPVDGAIMITASHLPYNRNGFKFFTSEGGLGKPDIKDILQCASSIYDKLSEGGVKVSNKDVNASVKKVDYMSIYTSDLVAAVRKAAGNKEKPLEGFHIIVDAGNGSGGFFAIFPEQLFDAQGIVQHNFSFNRKTTFLLDRCLCTTSAEETAKVLEPLGAVTIGSQFLEPDGMFPNHIPNPEDKTAMQAITKAVLDNKADLGIIFDTDVDRSAAVDSTGRELNRNRLIALMAAIVLEEHPGTTIVTDSVTSDGLTTFIENKLGGKHHRFKRGYKNVIDEAIRLNSTGEESHLAMETSGHGALKENHWLDDGAYLMVKLLNKLAAAKSEDPSVGSEILTDMIDGLEEAAVAVEIRLKIDQHHADLKGGSFRDYGEAVLKHMDNTIESYPQLKKAVKNFEGVRASGNGGWFLLRLSLHDPVLPLNIEAPSSEDALKLGLAVLNVVKEFPALDISALSKFIQQF